MSSTRQLLQNHTIETLFTIVYTVVDDYIKQSLESQRFNLPRSETQKATYAELMTIAFVGEFLNQPESGTWFLMIKYQFGSLFGMIPELARKVELETYITFR